MLRAPACPGAERSAAGRSTSRPTRLHHSTALSTGLVPTGCLPAGCWAVGPVGPAGCWPRVEVQPVAALCKPAPPGRSKPGLPGRAHQAVPDVHPLPAALARRAVRYARHADRHHPRDLPPRPARSPAPQANPLRPRPGKRLLCAQHSTLCEQPGLTSVCTSCCKGTRLWSERYVPGMRDCVPGARPERAAACGQPRLCQAVCACTPHVRHCAAGP